MFKPRSVVAGAFAATVLLLSGGCAVNPTTSHADMKRVGTAERDMLADAALAVETAPWPKPQQVSFVSRISGASDEDRITRSDAVAIYLNELQPAGNRFTQLAIDARANLVAAERLSRAAQGALAAPRLSMNDVTMLETAIQALRENRQIYTSVARQIEKSGEPVDEAQLDAIRTAYVEAIRALGQTADALADKIADDRTETLATPAKRTRKNFSGV